MDRKAASGNCESQGGAAMTKTRRGVTKASGQVSGGLGANSPRISRSRLERRATTASGLDFK